MKFTQQNINQSETWVGGFQLLAELYGNIENLLNLLDNFVKLTW